MQIELMTAIIAGAILVLPWTFKIAGLWEKVKRWYSYVLAGLMFGLIGATLSLFANTSYLSIFKDSVIFWTIEFLAELVAVVLLIVGALGVSKQLLK